ncbi:metallophosphoesterase [Myxococcota bacterium]|nr:metallophosphoesterase [Myxococcota bacterium]MBU1413299.1 metallophosphoesterase [Myxococcota bacterium]MBU1510208.1 metallophosphoesterase [Myxococcota bacterium]
MRPGSGHTQETTPAAAEKPTSGPGAPAVKRISVKPGQVVTAIGDIHGDLTALRGALKLAGAIDEKDQWIGGDGIVVLTGDYLDRGDDEKAIWDLLLALQGQAETTGGAVFPLIGNHEMLNAQGDFDSVSMRGKLAFNEKGLTRRQLFAPGGRLALLLATRKVTLVIGRTVFVHGGITTTQVRRGLDELNLAAAGFLEGTRPSLDFDVNTMLWMRHYSNGVPSAEICEELAATLRLLDADRMVVGHTPQKTINAACDGRAWRIDVGLSRHYGSNGPEVLVIQDNRVKVLR